MPGKATFSTNGTPPGSDEHKIDIDQFETGDALIIRGKGSHEITVDNTTMPDGLAVNLRGGAFDTVNVANSSVTRGLLQISSNAFQFLRSTVDNCEVQGKGSLSVRSTGEGNDVIAVEDCDVGGRLQVSTFDKNDTVRVNGCTVGKDLMLFGGSGTDLLDQGQQDANTVTGKTVEDSFEGAAPPPP